MSKWGSKAVVMSENAMHKLKILVLAHDRQNRKFIKEAIASVTDDVAIDEMSIAANAISALNDKNYAFFFIGLRPSDYSELDAIRFAKNAIQAPYICVISEAADEKSVFFAIANGASSYVWKSESPVEIKRLIARVIEGGSALSSVAVEALISGLHKNSAINSPTILKLTPKESQVINMSAKGYNFKEISSVMNIKMSTIYTHVRHIYEKLQVSSLSQALKVAREQGLINAPFQR